MSRNAGRICRAAALAALAAIVLFPAVPGAVCARVPSLVSYQGRLTDAAGQPVSDGTYSLTFAVYPSPTGGTPLWMEEGRSVSVSGGLFTVLLGEVTPLPSQGFPETSWLETRVAGTPLAPRVRLVSAPYALRAGSADQVPPSAAVTSLNSLTGNVTLAAGDNISLSQSGSTITLSGLNIPNPLPVSQSGAWNVGITGTPGVNVANSPVVRIDASQNTVKSPTLSNYVQLWTSDQTVAVGGSLSSPNIDCTGYREVRIILLATTDGYTESDRILVNWRYLAPNGSLPLIGQSDFAVGTVQALTNGAFRTPAGRAVFSIPVVAPVMRIEIFNNRTSGAITIVRNSVAYLVN